MKEDFYKRKIILFFIFVFIYFYFLYFLGNIEIISAKDVNEIKKELDLINRKLKESKKKLYYQNLAKKDLEKQLNDTWHKIVEYETQMKLINKKIAQIEKKIKSYKKRIEDNKKRIKEIELLIDMKLNFAIKYSGHWILLAFTISSPDTLLDAFYLIKKTIEVDLKLINSLSNEYSNLKKNMVLLNREQKELDEYKKKLDFQTKYYNSLLEKRKFLLAQYNEKISKIKQDIDYYEDIKKDKEEELRKYIVSRQSLNIGLRYKGGRFLWPTNSNLITSYFGYRVHPIYGNTRFHSGIDIGASYGAPIYAAESGRVILASWYDGYGYCIVIDHGDGVSTLYAHCSSIIVREGQYVSKGTIIGYVGSTGNSTGPHLHFEVRINGNPVNPLNYF